jgi:hypothetical protein
MTKAQTPAPNAESADDEVRPLRKSEMESLKGGAQPGPVATPLPELVPSPLSKRR